MKESTLQGWKELLPACFLHAQSVADPARARVGYVLEARQKGGMKCSCGALGSFEPARKHALPPLSPLALSK